MTTSLRDLIDAATASGAPMPPEVAAFLALEVAERLAARPARVSPVFVELSGDGQVSLASSSGASVHDAVRSLGRLLSEMTGGPESAPPGLDAVVRRSIDGAADAYRDLDSVRRDLEAYLVPLNRGAARRVLARYLREVLRSGRDDDTQDGMDLEVLGEGEPAPPPGEDVDEILAGLEPGARATRPVPDVGSPLDALEPARRPDALADTDQALDSILQDLPTHPRISMDPPTEASPPPAGIPPLAKPAPAVPVPDPAPVPGRATPTGARTSPPIVIPDVPEPRSRRGFGLLLVTVVLLLGALFAMLYQSRPDLFGSSPARTGEAAGGAAPVTTEPPRRVEYGTLTVESQPAGAEVLLYVGHGPVEVTHLPVGVAHEFVVLGEDGRVARAVVPADAPFAPRPDGPDPVATELAVQLPQEEDAAAAPWPRTKLPPGGPAEGSGQLGTVRIVTNPLGARVFLLVGFTPTAPISNLRLDQAYELLVVKEGHARERVLVGRSDWRRSESGRDFAHRASVTLRPEAERPAKDTPGRRRRRR